MVIARRATASEEDTPQMSMTDSTQISESWVKNQIRTSQDEATDAIMTAVADVISAEPKTCQKAEEDIAVLRQELAALKAEVAELRGNSGFAARLMALRSGWPNSKRHWYGSRLLADRRTRVAAVAAAAVVVLAAAVVILPMPR